MELTDNQKERIIDVFQNAKFQTKDRFIFQTETPEDKKYLESIYLGVFKKKLNPGCGACSLVMLNFLRIKVGLPSLVNDSGKGLYKKRIYICKGCDRLNSLGTNCKECGCLIHIKARFKIFKCPLGKWKNV